MTDAAPPGWYPDPRDPAIEFWWGRDGVRALPAGGRASGNGSRTRSPRRIRACIGFRGPVFWDAGRSRAPAVRSARAGERPGRPGVPKSRTVAAILGFFLGGLGVDRFYLGNIGMGVAKLLVGWLPFGIRPLVDWIVILAGAAHDGDDLRVVNWS